MKQGLPLAPGMGKGNVIRDARKWKVDPERTVSEFDPGFNGGLLGRAWTEIAFLFKHV
jgi:hypothetical protein